MKNIRILSFIFLPMLLGCSAKEETAAPPPAKVAAVDPVAPPIAPASGQPAVTNPTSQGVPVVAAVVISDLPASETWNSIKDDTYDQRGHFAAGLEHITARLDNAIQLLNAKRLTLPETSTQDWDFAMKELAEARTNLRYQLTQLNTATPDTWNEQKDRVAAAWQRASNDYDKVKLSTTI